MRPGLLWVPVSLVVMTATLGAGWAVSRGAEQRPSVAAAFDALPASTLTVDYTDWSTIDVSLEDASLSGLTTRSVLAPLDAEMREVLGWSGSDGGVDWEVYGRIDGGAVSVLGLGDVSAARAEQSFAAISTSAGDDVYRVEEGTGLSRDFVSTFRWVRVVPGRDVVLAADDERSLAAAIDVVTGGEPSLLGVRALVGLADRLEGATSALLLDRVLLCRGAALDPADPASAQLNAVLGPDERLADPRWGGRALYAGDPQRIVFATAFGSDEVAREQAELRRRLATGPFIGRSGQVADSLQDLRLVESGGVVSLDFALTPSGEQFMTDTGRVLFAGCAT